MPRTDRTQPPDPQVQTVLDALAPFEQQHPQADIAAYRQDAFAIRIRIIDPDFTGRDRAARESLIWPLLEQLPDETLSDVTVLLLLTPDEAQHSFANFEFDDPIPSGL